MMIFLLFIFQFITVATRPISITPPTKSLAGGMTDNRAAIRYVDSMSQNSVLKVTESLVSNNGFYKSSKTSGNPFSILQIRNDGNLVISNSKKMVWDSNTQRYLTAKKVITPASAKGDPYGFPQDREEYSGNIDGFLDGDGGLSETDTSGMGLIGDLSLGLVNMRLIF